MDFTFVCPTEIAEFGKRNSEFEDRDAQLLGMSTDTHFVHLAWRRDHADLKSLPSWQKTVAMQQQLPLISLLF